MAEDPRLNRIEEAISQLSNVAHDVAKMLAVHEQRIQQQEKIADAIGNQLEKRKDEVDKKFENVYEAIKEGDAVIIAMMEKTAETREKQFSAIDKKISRLEKWSWMAIGGGLVVGFLLSLAFNIIKVVH
jgi:hypothetical protein